MFTHYICGESGKAFYKHLLNQTKTSQFQVDFLSMKPQQLSKKDCQT